MFFVAANLQVNGRVYSLDRLTSPNPSTIQISRGPRVTEMKLRTAFDHMVPRHVRALVASTSCCCTGVDWVHEYADRYPMTKHLNIPKSVVSVFLDVYALSVKIWNLLRDCTDIPNRYTEQISQIHRGKQPWNMLLKPVVDTGRISLLNFT